MPPKNTTEKIAVKKWEILKKVKDQKTQFGDIVFLSEKLVVGGKRMVKYTAYRCINTHKTTDDTKPRNETCGTDKPWEVYHKKEPETDLGIDLTIVTFPKRI